MCGPAVRSPRERGRRITLLALWLWRALDAIDYRVMQSRLWGVDALYGPEPKADRQRGGIGNRGGGRGAASRGVVRPAANAGPIFTRLRSRKTFATPAATVLDSAMPFVFLYALGREPVVNHIRRLIWPGYRDRSGWFLVRRQWPWGRTAAVKGRLAAGAFLVAGPRERATDRSLNTS